MSDRVGRHSSPRLMRSGALVVLIIALALTLIDAAKPLVIDDGLFYQIARQIAQDPADPYGFELHWYAEARPAVEVVAPPVVPYWWAAALKLFGDRAVVWKLWLFPFALLLTASCARLLCWIAPTESSLLLCAALISPAVLPALNLMLDLPALALVMASLVLLIEACQRPRGLALALAAGVLGGLALQTKYNSVIPLVAGLAYAGLARRWAAALVTGAVAAGLFVGWDVYISSVYGESHFLLAADFTPRFSTGSVMQQAVALVCLLGASSPVVVLLALRHRPGWSAAFGAAVTLGLAAVAFLPPDAVASVGPVFPEWGSMGSEVWVLGPAGLLVGGTAAWSVARMWARLLEARREGRPIYGVPRIETLLLVWLALECAGFFLISPYPALRRVIGLHVVLAFLVGRAASSGVSSGGRCAAARVAIVAWGSALGLLFAISDVSDARARRQGISSAIARLDDETGPEARGVRWYVGHWGFLYYAERAGLEPIVVGTSRLEPGDWLVVPFGVHRQPIRPPPGSVEQVTIVPARSSWPWSTLPAAYSGYRPIRPQPDAQLQIVLLRVVAPFTASAR